MIQCPECKEYSVEFNSHFKRPRCYSCGWLPSECCKHIAHKLFDPCDKCWGYDELRCMGSYCDRCRNKGKVPNSLGREVVEIIQAEGILNDDT